LSDISRFLEGHTDDNRLEDLLWGLLLAERLSDEANDFRTTDARDGDPVPRAYALLKLAVLPGRITWKDGSKGAVLRHTLRADTEGAVAVHPEAAMLARLGAGDVAGACQLAIRRLRVAGFTPLPGSHADGSRRDVSQEFTAPPNRLLASLLFPITNDAVDALGQMVLRRPTANALA
jgi:CRISPR-associated protein Csx17